MENTLLVESGNAGFFKALNTIDSVAAGKLIDGLADKLNAVSVNLFVASNYVDKLAFDPSTGSLPSGQDSLSGGEILIIDGEEYHVATNEQIADLLDDVFGTEE